MFKTSLFAITLISLFPYSARAGKESTTIVCECTDGRISFGEAALGDDKAMNDVCSSCAIDCYLENDANLESCERVVVPTTKELLDELKKKLLKKKRPLIDDSEFPGYPFP